MIVATVWCIAITAVQVVLSVMKLMMNRLENDRSAVEVVTQLM